MWKEVTQMSVPVGIYTLSSNLKFMGYDQNYNLAFFSLYVSAGVQLLLQMWSFKSFEADYGYKSATFYAANPAPTAWAQQNNELYHNLTEEFSSEMLFKWLRRYLYECLKLN